MGRQVRFYMLPEDELVFIRFLSQDNGLLLLEPTSPNRVFPIIDYDLNTLVQRTQGTRILLSNREFPIEEKWIQTVHRQQYIEQRGEFVETGEVFFSIDKLSSPVIVFTPSILRADGILTKGRIWADMYWLEGDELSYKGKKFEAWYTGIARWITRKFKKVPGIDGYLGGYALDWYQKGGLLQDM